jgi:hypothetical protein
MRTIRERLTYANVVSSLALFLVLCGGLAYAARVPRKSVGPKQLKSNAVTTAKIKANAVTTRKIKREAVSNAKIKRSAIETEKIADGSVTRSDLDSSSMPFSRIVFEARGNSTLELDESVKSYPLDNPTYFQEAFRDDAFMGAMDVSFKPTCNPPREVQALILVDSPKPTEPATRNIVASGQFDDEGGEVTSGRINLGSVGGLFQSPATTKHTLSLVAFIHCSSGSGATATFGGVDVIGTKK